MCNCDKAEQGNFSAGWNLVKLERTAANPKKFATDARRGGKEFHLRSEKKLTAFVQLEPPFRLSRSGSYVGENALKTAKLGTSQNA
jgi:hypothetical protein